MILNIHCDGSCYHKNGMMGIGVAFFSDDMEEPYLTMAKYVGDGTSNQAEYLAILWALYTLTHTFETLMARGVQKITINSDSQIVINQINSVFQCREETLLKFQEQVKVYRDEIMYKIHFNWVPRENERQQQVDKLSKQGNPYFSERIKG